MKLKPAHVSIAIVCLILGVMLAVQFRTNQRDPSNLSANRWSELTIRMDNLEKERDALAEEAASLREQMGKTSSSKESVAMKAMKEELAKANRAAGLTALKGPGVIITLNDNPNALAPDQDPNNNLIHDEDLLKVANELKAAGAEAISINGNRLVSTSEIRCAGPTILVNANKIAPPFVIKAIGDPEVLLSSMRMKGGYLEQMQVLYGIESQIAEAKIVEIPAYNGAMRFQYAVPDKS
ncbi:MAG: DUF881 domain-containing protein [Ignavibacteriales bacterium]